MSAGQDGLLMFGAESWKTGSSLMLWVGMAEGLQVG